MHEIEASARSRVVFKFLYIRFWAIFNHASTLEPIECAARDTYGSMRHGLEPAFNRISRNITQWIWVLKMLQSLSEIYVRSNSLRLNSFRKFSINLKTPLQLNCFHQNCSFPSGVKNNAEINFLDAASVVRNRFATLIAPLRRERATWQGKQKKLTHHKSKAWKTPQQYVLVIIVKKLQLSAS